MLPEHFALPLTADRVQLESDAGYADLYECGRECRPARFLQFEAE
jgi:hypothetical protein